MRLRQQTTSRLLLTSLFGLQVHAHPYPKDDLHDVGYSFVMDRACAQYCGLDNEYCCDADSACITDEAGSAMCAAGMKIYTTTWTDVREAVTGRPGRKRGEDVYTTTWTETNTYTSTITTKFADGPPAPLDTTIPCTPIAEGQTGCGWVCCAWWQECAYDGQCRARPGCENGICGGGGGGGGIISGGGDGSESTVVITTTDEAGKPTTLYSAPYRVTGTGSETAAPTNFGTGAEQQGTGGGLSPGAIAGIVIGTLVGIGLLILICFCCIVKGLFSALFGGKKKKKERERIDVYEESYSRHGSRVPSARHSRRDNHSSWYGSGRSPHRKEKSSGKGWLGLIGAAGTILALLNMKKDKKRPPKRKPETVYTDSYYSYSGTGTTPSSSSSGGGGSRYTRRTGNTRLSRGSRSHR